MTFAVNPNDLKIAERFWLDPQKLDAFQPTAALQARCRLKNAREWFAARGWNVLPQNERGRRILEWGADHAWLAASGNPQTSVRRWCRKFAPRLTIAELNELVAKTEHSNRRWSADQCAAVLEVSVADRERHKLWHIGANDDPNYEIRRGIQRAKAAERARKRRVKNSTGAKKGRPALRLSPEEKLARSNAQAAERMKRHRALRKNASRTLIDINPVTDFSVTRDCETKPTRPESIQIDGRRQPEPRHSMTAIERKDARCREPTISNISEEDRLLNAQIGELQRSIGGCKSRMSERMPLSRKARAYALAACFTPEQVDLMFSTFRYWNIAKGTWSQDWDEVWINWIDRQVTIDTEEHHRRRTRAYFEQRAS